MDASSLLLTARLAAAAGVRERLVVEVGVVAVLDDMGIVVDVSL